MHNPPIERIRLCACRYDTARHYFDRYRADKWPDARSFQFVCLAVQMRALSRGVVVYLCPGWQNLQDANSIRVAAVMRQIELVTL